MYNLCNEDKSSRYICAKSVQYYKSNQLKALIFTWLFSELQLHHHFYSRKNRFAFMV